MSDDESRTFIPGLTLARLFYGEAVAPILALEFGGIPHAAALIGAGSEVLGFDTEMSSDHHWGPRVMLFLRREDVARLREPMKATLSRLLPRRFRGYPTGYTEANPNDNGVQLLDETDDGTRPLNHRVEILTADGYISDYLGVDAGQELTAADWLTLPEQKLRSLVAGEVFHDEVGLAALRERFAYYPPDVWLYLLASCWARIEQDEHLMGRAGFVGDEVGSAIIGARLVRDLMRLCFLMEKQYAPYGKWFGTAFRRLGCAAALEPSLRNALTASTWQERERFLVPVYESVARMHNQLAITAPLPAEAASFHGRPFLTISRGRFSSAILEQIRDPQMLPIARRRPVGNIDLVSDNTDLLEDRWRRSAMRRLYE